MRRTLKRVVCLLLTLILAAGLLSGLTISASALTTAERQQAVIATALAYFDKGHNVQYDGSTIVDGIDRGDGGKTRSTNQSSPEDATPQETMYTVCSDFAHQIYYETFRYQLRGSAGRCWTGGLIALATEQPEIVVWSYDRSSGKSAEEEVTKMFALAQPGDVYTATGHTMIWAGDLDGDGKPDIIHSGGRHMTVPLEKGKRTDIREYKTESDPGIDSRYEAVFGPTTNGGSIRINDAESYIRENYMNKEGQSLVRPIQIMKPDDYINPAALYRVSHPRLAINRYLNKTRFASAYTGETVTMTLELCNSSDKTYTVPVTEKTPEGAKLKTPFKEAKVSGDTQTWNVELKPGDVKSFTCEYEITAPFGGEVVFAGGSVGDIPSNSIPIQVGGAKLNEEEKAKLAAVAKGDYDELIKSEKANNSTMADIIYQKVLGLNVQIPSFKDVTKKCTKSTKTPAGKSTHVFLKKDEIAAENQVLYRMLVPNCWGGHAMWCPFGSDRCSEPLDKHLEPGDVIIRCPNYSSSIECEQMIYLGNGKYLTCRKNTGIYPRVEEPEFFMCLTYEIFYVLRPTLAYEDVHTLSAPPKEFKFTDVKESDWFYTYVKDLVEDGTVNGMTETTFVPNGTLTYGQALKLITLAVGEKEQAKSGTHWASGYLTLAKSKGWLAEDVNLDGTITRLQLCKVAAKAKGLTEQPAANPFTDTSDPDVLALNKVGVINGMTATEFQPNGLLTRAQISKIIHTLRQVK